MCVRREEINLLVETHMIKFYETLIMLAKVTVASECSLVRDIIIR